MSQVVTAADTEPLLSAADIEMRNTSGLTRRTIALQEDGDALERGDPLEDRKGSSGSLAALPPSLFRDALKLANKCGSGVFLVAVGLFFLGSVRSGRIFREQNSFFNFLHFYLHIGLMVLAIMGLMHVMKVDKKIE